MKIIASWDDGAYQDFRIAELMKKYNIPTIFYWPFNLNKSLNLSKVKKFLTMNDCLELSKNFEIGSHTVTHSHLTKLTQKQAENEIFNSRKLWQDKTGQEINSFCYPRGYYNNFIKILVKNAGYINARTTIVGFLSPGDDLYESKTTIHVGIDRKEYGDISWELFSKKMLNEAKIKQDNIFHIMGHSWEIDLYNDWENLENLLKELG